MKTIKKVLLVGAVLLVSLNFLLSQTVLVGGFNNVAAPVQIAAPVQPAQSDSIVQITAEAQGLQLLSPDQAQFHGGIFCYWWVMPGGAYVPMPFLPQDASVIFQIADNQYLVDESGGQIIANTRRPGGPPTRDMIASMLATQADWLVGLITQVQTTAINRQMRMLARSLGMDDPSPFPGGDGFGDGSGGDYTNSFNFWFDRTQLWLEITNVANGSAVLNLHNATNLIYAIWSTTNLATPCSGWQVETEVWPTDTNCQLFTVATLNRQNLFLRAEDWTGVDSDGDGIPDWWIWKYFGNLSENSTNLDSQGNMLGYDYTNGLDPNVISFTVRLGNQNFNSSPAVGSYLVLGGVPSYEAVLVNDTNLNDAVWQPYDGNILMNLGSTDGVYQVQFGLKGRAADSQSTWLGTEVTLNRQAPQIVITSPMNNVVAQPYVLLQGYTTLPLASVTFDVSNAVAVLTNQLGAIIQHTLDTNTLTYTTDYFECVDILLTTNGANLVTVHATDPAGNTTSTTLNLTLDYATATNPAVNLAWPQDGMEISGDTFTLRGQVDDSSAAVSATITDEDGNTTTAYGLVERDGTLWVDDLPLAEGENDVVLTVVNSAGLSSETDFMVVKSEMTLTLDTINGDLWQPWVNVGGSIFDPSYTVSVNGVQGTNNGDGTWSACQVPVSASGEASFDVVATPPAMMAMSRLAGMTRMSTPSGNPVNANKRLDKPDEVKLESGNWTTEWSDNLDDGLGGALEYSLNVWNWSRLAGGLENDFWEAYHAADTNFYTQTEIYHILPDRTVPLEHVEQFSTSGIGNASFDLTNVPMSDPDGLIAWLHEVPQQEGALSYHSSIFDLSLDEHGRADFERFTGGRLVNGDESLYVLDGTVVEKLVMPNGTIIYSNVPPEQVTVDMLGNLDANGEVTKLLPTQTKMASNLSAGVPRSTVNVTASPRYKAHITCTGYGDVTGKTVSAIVGQKISLTCQLQDANGNPPPAAYTITNYQWTVPGITFSDYVATATSGILYTDFPKTNSEVDYYWVDGGNKQVSCDVKVLGQTLTAQTTFDVIRPEVTWTLTPKDTVAVDTLMCDTSDLSNYYHLRTGKKCTTNDVGMWYVFNLTDLKGYKGNYSFQFVQVITIDWKQNLDLTNHPNWSKYTAGRGLDETYPYQSWNGTSGVADDTPYDVLTANIAFDWRRDNFESYIMFTPENGKPVPLKLANWNWYGRAKKITDDDPPAFLGIKPFVNQQSSVGTDCYIHPAWTNNIQYFKSHWTYQPFQFTTP